MKKLLFAALAFFALSSPAWADCSGGAIPGLVLGNNTACNYLNVNADGSINVSVGGGATTGDVTGTASQTSTTSTSLVGAVTSNKLYILTVSCSNSGSSNSLVALQDGSGGTTLWSILVPAGGGNNIAASRPIFATTSGNALYFAPGTASTTVTCNAAGFSGS